MDNLSPDMIARLRDLFGQMTDSRRQLRPILADIAASIDKGFFIDADSDEVNRLLKQILDAQEQLSAVEQLKRVAASKKLEQVDKSLDVLEQNCKRDAINSTLARIETLEVDSDDQAILDAVKKVKLQAEHIRNKSGKLDAAQFAKLAERFIMLANIIDSAEEFSSAAFLNVTSSFQDNPLIAMVLTQHIVHFPGQVPFDFEDIEDEPPMPIIDDDAEDALPTKPTKHRLSAVILKAEKVKPDLSLVLIDEKNFAIERAAVKKQLSIKSFNNKVHELFDSVDPMPIFKILIKTRIFFSDDPKDILVSGKLTKKIAALVPRIFDKLFSWGIVDKVNWRERVFYFLNDFGLDLCIRSFTHTSPPSGSSDYFEEMISSLQFSVMFMSEARLRGDLKLKFAYNPIVPAARAELLDIKGSINVILMFSLILLGDNWAYNIARFKLLIEHEINANVELKAVFLFAFTKNDLPWLKMFETAKFRRIKFFMLTWDGLWDNEGKEVDLDNWSRVCNLGIPAERPPASADSQSAPQIKIPPSLNDAKIAAFAKKIAKKPWKNLTKTERGLITKIAGGVMSNGVKFGGVPINKFFAESDFKSKSKRNMQQQVLPGFEYFAADSDMNENIFDENATPELFDTKPSDSAVAPEINLFEDTEPVETETAAEIIESDTAEPVETVESETAVEIIEPETLEPATTEVEIVEAEKTSADDIVKADILSSVTNLFKIEANGRGMLALHALRDYFSGEEEGDAWAEYITKEIGFILDDPLTLRALHNFDTFTFWTGGAEIPKANISNTFDYLNLAATIKNFYAPVNPTSYQLQKIWKQLNDDKANTALKACPAAKTLISLFNNFTDKTHRAFADCLNEVGNNIENNYKAALAQIKAVENIADSVLHSDVNHRRVKDVIQQLFKNNGFARKYLYVDNFSADEILEFCRRFEKSDLREVLADNAATIDDELFSDEKIDDFLDDVWNNPVVQLVRREHEKFLGPKRKKVAGVMKQVLTALLNYLHAKRNLEISGSGDRQSAPVERALEILADLQKQISRTDKRPNLGQAVFRAFVDNLTRKINGETAALSYRECLLGKNYIELENDLPVIDSFGVEEFSLKNRTEIFEADIRDKSLGENLRAACDTALKNYDCGVYQYLAKYFMAQLNLAEEEVKRKVQGLEKQADRQIERIYNDFLNDIELARNYSRITDQEKIDSYINAVVDAKEHFAGTKNAGLFQRFVNACNESIKRASLPQRNALTKRLEKLEENLETTLENGETLEARYPILANVRRQIDLMNLTVAEDYMNRLETEGGSLLTELDVIDSDLRTLEDFLADYENLFRAIQNANGSLEDAYRQRSHITVRNINREIQNSLDFLHGWRGINSGHNPAIEKAIPEILSHLGYSGGVISKQNVDELNQKSYIVNFPEPIKARDSYPHPFAVFGTEIYTKGLEVIYLGASRRYDNVTQVLSDMTADRGTICLMNHTMTLPDRRKLARDIKLNANLKNIVIIDKVMALYLARFDEANRGKRMLQTALPFARVQPYTAGGFVAPEMFIGRSEELDQIRDMAGPVFVYGGRQLGKSALLRQVKSIEHNPAQLNYAFFIDLKNLDSEQTLKKIVYELKNSKLIGEVDTWQDFSFEMHKLLDGQIQGVYKPKKLLLLLDESDAFLSSKDSEQAIDILRELLVAFSGKFKFVLAGLHKVIRFEQNSSFGNLNHISVLPFRPSDAMELLVKPMSYLGFRVADDSLLSAIFSRTNYYPGSIQYYCKMLVDAVSSNYVKQNFDVTKNPPYTLDDDYLKNMLGNSEFQNEINTKFQITLHLDDDNYYEILALAVALIYYEHNRPVSVDVTEIKNICLMCGVDKINNLSNTELLSLLDEMVALNLLRRVDGGKFEFNRYAFWHMMGTESEVTEKLDSYGLNAD